MPDTPPEPDLSPAMFTASVCYLLDWPSPLPGDWLIGLSSGIDWERLCGN